jgi:hypothetical protein
MKNNTRIQILYFFLVITLFVGCKKEKEEVIAEVPEEIIRTELDPILYPQIAELFPDSKNALINYPQLFNDTIQKNIVLTEESEVYITFVAEKATYKNTVGWYSYTPGNAPKTTADVNIHLLFPNVSAKGEGGELIEGDMLQLGDKKFPKGTVIGFFLIVNGWKDGTIRYGNQTHYTDYCMNLGEKQQHVLFKEKDGKNIILGFEDMSYEAADKDYNDILFIISDNKNGFESIFFDLKKMLVL